MNRRIFVAGGLGLTFAGCSSVTNALNDNTAIKGVVDSAESLNHVVIGTRGMAKLYAESDITRDFPVNGLDTPTTDAVYGPLMQHNFAGYRLPVVGLVDHPQTFTLPQLRALASLTQITRHDCVEGWSVVGKWGGVPLATILGLVRPQAKGRYVVFYSYDQDSQGTPFYGSIDLKQAAHPQTQLALDLNGMPIDAGHGGPVRLRIPTQLAYKSTKWVRKVEIVSSFDHIYGGHGGYWEDQGYEWYAGI